MENKFINGLKIKNIKAGTLYGYNLNTRVKYDYTNAVFNKSQFFNYMIKNGLTTNKNEDSTCDLICLEFDFGSRSYEEEIDRINEMISEEKDEEKIQTLNGIKQYVNENKDNFFKRSKEEIREYMYLNPPSITYSKIIKSTGEIKETTITYKMLYRNSSKAKLGQVMFINSKLYNKAITWLTMGLNKKIKKDKEAKIVELSAYAPLTTSTIVDELYIPVEDILILNDKDSFFKTIANVVSAEEYDVEVKVFDEEATNKAIENAIKKGNLDDKGNPKYRNRYKKQIEKHKKCVVNREETEVKNTLWDGMALIEASLLPKFCNGMALFRNHFFKVCAFKSYLQLFFKDWCKKTGNDYNTYEVEDMFGIKHKLKDIKMITTNNAIKWLKFKELMGDTIQDAYYYWMDKVNDDGSLFGIVKTDHPSKLGDVQQMSYQMINTLPCTKEDIKEIAKTSIKYVELLKFNNDEFEKFLRSNANEINHYEMMADLYVHNHDFANSKWFRNEKKKIINTYVTRLRSGKITLNADNLTCCGNPYALLLYTVGEDYTKDETLNVEEGTIQCYTTRFNDGEYLCGIRNPHNSPNNICYFHNKHSKLMKRYFPFSKNIIAINCLQTDVQDRANGMDFDLTKMGRL